MGDIFNEVDEAVRQEQWQKLWKRYGHWLIAVVVLAIVGTAAGSLWNYYREQQRIESAARFSSALELLQANDHNAAVSALSDLADNAASGYALLASFREAEALLAVGDRPGAIAVYEEIAGDSSVDVIYRDLAALYAAMHLMAAEDYAAAAEKVAPLTVEDRPWRYVARELDGHIALAQGDEARAREIFSALADDAGEAPAGVQSRAEEVLRALNGVDGATG